MFFIFFFIFFTPLSLAAIESSPDAQKIIRQQESQNQGFHDEVLTGTMVLINAQNQKTAERQFEFKRIEQSSAAPSKSVIKIIKPADLQGTSLLSIDHAIGADEQWLYLPAYGKSKRIVGQGKGGRFLGSEFIYEDLIPKNEHDFEHTYLRLEKYKGKNCYVLSSKSKKGDSAYLKTVVWIEEANLLDHRIDFYNKKGELTKLAFFKNYKKINNRFWRPFLVLMQDVKKGTQTELILSDLKIASGLKDADFSRASLER